MPKYLRFFLLASAGLLLLYRGWSRAGRVGDDTSLPAQPQPEITFYEVGNPGAAVRLVGIQPYMQPADYATGLRFYQRLNDYFAAAAQRGLLPAGAVVVLPEHLGTWLVAAGEKQAVFTNPHSQDALRLVALSNLSSFVRAMWRSSAQDKVTAALFLMKARQTAAIYEWTFKKLAADYQVTIVAGSVVLPDAVVKDGHIVPVGNKLYNASFVFTPDGRMEPAVVRKQYPIEAEQPFCEPAGGMLPAFNTAAGRLGVAICADSWYPSVYEQLQTAGVEVMAVPSYSTPDSLWATPWQGYNGAAMPDDVRPQDVGNITEEQAWLRYSMGGRAATAGVRYGINVFLRGQIWDLGDDGRTIVYYEGNTYLATPYEGPQITVVRY
ncbi:MAG TPA: carbon-nitrogen hydrolase family protein [Flammeovirgaceae bacterium]|nr:carbon-nitrogen hydrolase family protein [Flammeovirgaceae bacterium]